jgi:hypothetical protein
MIRELVCKVFGHKLAYIRANYNEQALLPPEERSFEIEFGCARCMQTLDQDDYDEEEVVNRTQKTHEQFDK